MKNQIIRFPGPRRLAAALAAAAILSLSAFPAAASDVFLVPVGRAVGIKLFADGAVVSELSVFSCGGEPVCPAADAGLRRGDVIVAADGAPVTVSSDLSDALDGRENAAVLLTVLRDGLERTVSVVPRRSDGGGARIGAVVRDSTAGIGTLTFYDPDSGTFAALGHGICDGDTGLPAHLGHGCLVPATVTGVKKGRPGDPGELIGLFGDGPDCGALSANTETGLYGSLSPAELYPELLSADPVPVADSVETGPAVVLANVSGGEVRRYEIEIVRINNLSRSTKNYLIRVTDPVLLEATGGIVQGMSGSPILQNGRLVGAVTHVLVNDPTRGYGIWIENMLPPAKAAVPDAA